MNLKADEDSEVLRAGFTVESVFMVRACPADDKRDLLTVDAFGDVGDCRTPGKALIEDCFFFGQEFRSLLMDGAGDTSDLGMAYTQFSRRDAILAEKSLGSFAGGFDKALMGESNAIIGKCRDDVVLEVFHRDCLARPFNEIRMLVL